MSEFVVMQSDEVDISLLTAWCGLCGNRGQIVPGSTISDRLVGATPQHRSGYSTNDGSPERSVSTCCTRRVQSD